MINSTKIESFGKYYPYGHCKDVGVPFDEFGKKILDLKDNEEVAKQWAYDLLIRNLDLSGNPLLICVPSSKEGITSGLSQVVEEVSKDHNLPVGANIIQRTNTVGSKHLGFKRTVQEEMDSCTINTECIIPYTDIYIIDDITTSGDSFSAAIQLIESLNLEGITIQCFALGRTSYHPISYYSANSIKKIF